MSLPTTEGDWLSSAIMMSIILQKHVILFLFIFLAFYFLFSLFLSVTDFRERKEEKET